MTFGEYFKKNRMKTGLTLRQFCKNKGLDAAYISRIENDMIPAPSKDNVLKSLAKAISIEENTPEWVEFFDFAATSRGEYPKDIQDNFPQVLTHLPAFLRSVKDQKMTKEDINDLVELVRSGYDDPEEQ